MAQLRRSKYLRDLMLAAVTKQQLRQNPQKTNICFREYLVILHSSRKSRTNNSTNKRFFDMLKQFAKVHRKYTFINLNSLSFNYLRM